MRFRRRCAIVSIILNFFCKVFVCRRQERGAWGIRDDIRCVGIGILKNIAVFIKTKRAAADLMDSWSLLA